jgi:hypothetical protein
MGVVCREISDVRKESGMIRVSGTLSKAWMAGALGVRFDRDYYFDPG